MKYVRYITPKEKNVEKICPRIIGFSSKRKA